jgi:hypothetical protein
LVKGWFKDDIGDEEFVISNFPIFSFCRFITSLAHVHLISLVGVFFAGWILGRATPLEE